MENLIDKQIKGFKFTELESVGYPGWHNSMERYIDKLGTIVEAYDEYVRVKFEDGTRWSYPINLIKHHLVNDASKPIELISLHAVLNNGLALEFVKNQTEEICKAAVGNNGFALMFVKEQTESICLAAVRNNGMALKFVKAQTERICLEAVKQNGMALAFVNESMRM